jgi:hypothetical protein
MPASRSARSMRPIGMPCMRSMVSTFTSGWQVPVHLGHQHQARIGMLRRSCAALAAFAHQVQLVVQVVVELGHHLARACRRLPSAERLSSQPAIRCATALRSFSMTGQHAGAQHLDGDSRSTAGRARWRSAPARSTHWPPAWRSNSEQTPRRSGGPRHARWSAIAILAGKGGTRSCSRASSSAMSAGSRSRRVESTWPNLTKMGPRRSSASRRRWPRGVSRRRPSRSMRASASELRVPSVAAAPVAAISSRPWRQTT